MLPKGMVSLLRHYGELEGLKNYHGVTGGGEDTSLSLVRLCKMRVPSNMALDMSQSPHLTINYLLKDK